MIFIKSKIFLFVFVSIFIFGITAAFAQSENVTLKQGDLPQRFSSPDEVSKLTEWKQFNFAEGSFSIFFPDKPGRHANSKSLAQGFANQYRYYWDTSDEQLYFEVQVLELLPEKSFNLELGVEGFKQQQKNQNAFLLNEKKIQVNGVNAVDFHYRIPDEPEPVLGYTRIMLCGNRLYTLMGAGTKIQKDLFEVVSRFFDSFSPFDKCEIQVTSETETKQSQINQRTTKTTTTTQTTTRRIYIRGPKGGCYYVNDKGNKVYVDKSLCR